jgi:hypothetical protein
MHACVIQTSRFLLWRYVLSYRQWKYHKSGEATVAMEGLLPFTPEHFLPTSTVLSNGTNNQEDIACIIQTSRFLLWRSYVM